MVFRRLLLLFVGGLVWLPTAAAQESPLKLATFSADITIPLGHRCMGILDTKAQRIDDPLEARGFVLLGPEAPVVFVALDWCEVRNGAYDQWRDTLAAAAKTTRQRVLVCSLHQHDAPVIDTEAQSLLDTVGLTGELFDVSFHQACLKDVASAIERASALAKPVTHVAIGQSAVENIASNRRLVLADGRVSYDRYSRTEPNSVEAMAEVGEIDPNLKSIHFFSGDELLAVLSSYATHPMSYYGQGGVSADFVGLARRRRQLDTPNGMQIYASGCSGDITAGKYNDGTPHSRGLLTDRLYRALVRASEGLAPRKLERIGFRCETLELPFHEGKEFERESMVAVLQNEQATTPDRILAAMGLASLNRIERGQGIDLACLDLGIAQVVVLPGESFVGYQLMAQQIRPDSFVMAIGYGECWTGYVPTQRAFEEGFNHGWRWVGPGCEPIIRNSLEAVLQATH
jgi:hypothetical protein